MMLAESQVPVAGGRMAVRHGEIVRDRSTILLVHGLGDSGLAFMEVFDTGLAEAFNVVVPDNLGYGRSSAAAGGDYSLSSQVSRLWELAAKLGLDRFHLVGHSLGGDLGTLMCDGDDEGRILSFVNVEGDLTPGDMFISGRVEQVFREGNFTGWFQREFKEDLVLGRWGRQRASCRRYYASLWFCDPEAFLSNARELVTGYPPLPGKTECRLGALFRSLAVPKVFCWGESSLCAGTRNFLEEALLPNRMFGRASHWLMIDQPDEFYGFLESFVGKA